MPLIDRSPVMNVTGENGSLNKCFWFRKRKPDRYFRTVPTVSTVTGRCIKRLGDLAGATILLVAFSPVLAVAAIAVVADSGRPVFFRQPRVGRRGRLFSIAKLRTMRTAAAGTAPLVTTKGDARITRVGRALRRTKLDELPQLWNVIRGDMSLVGPRPEVPHYVERFSREFAPVLDLRPGLTDMASVIFRDEEGVLLRHAGEPDYYERVLLPRKIALARLYRRRFSIRLDAKVLAATACLILGSDRLAAAMIGPAMVERARRGIA
jgi:lipopolysaccharide/colanic/teichoic acid biosynthesis glycosyltransferase